MKRMEKDGVSRPFTSKQQTETEIFYMERMEKDKVSHLQASNKETEIFYMERMEKERVFIHLQASNKERYFTWKG